MRNILPHDIILLDSVFDKALVWETNFLNQVESNINEAQLISLHFEMIVGRGMAAVSEYHRQLANGKNLIVEEFRKIASSLDLASFNEQTLSYASAPAQGIDDFNPIGQAIGKYLSKITSADSAPGSAASSQLPVNTTPAGKVSSLSGEEAFNAAISGGSYSPNADSTISGTAMKVLKAITEDGSLIGITHLILDLIGLFGDAVIPGLGVASDLINATIYFIRASLPNAPDGMVFLGVISLIAALLPGVGDSLKIFKPVVGPTGRIFSAIFKRGEKAGAEELSKVAAKDRGMVVQFLSLIAKYTKVAFGKAAKVLGDFTTKFVAKVTGYVPFIGPALKNFFKRIGDTLSQYGVKVEKAADDIGKITKSSEKMSADAWENYIKQSEKSAVKALEKTRGRLARFFKKSRGTMQKFYAFIGKQITKIMYSDSQLTPSQEETIGQAAFTDWVQQQRIKQKEETGATYIPDFMIDSQDQEAVDRVVKLQNGYAEKMGQPSIIPVVYSKFKNEGVEESFADLWKKVGEGTISREDITIEEVEPTTDDFTENKEVREVEEKNESFKYIIPFSKFNR